MKRIVTWFALAGFGITSFALQAATLSVTPTSSNAMVGESVMLDVQMDFVDDPTLGGGFDVLFDANRLVFVSFEFDAALGDEPVFRRDPDVSSGRLGGIAFGAASFNGLAGPAKVGQLTFTAQAPGLASVSLQVNGDLIPGPFVSAGTNGAQTVAFAGAVVDIAPVPLPAAAWLLVGGLGVLGIARARRR